jgi:ABC-type antimicrobial peptide transport system permease subunit
MIASWSCIRVRAPMGDPVTVLVIALVMLGVSTVAAYLPARRATRLPPVRVSG